MTPPLSRPTIHDVAALAGVSKSLVSLVLRGSDRVSEQRRQAVLEAVARLGYRPNAAARHLARRRTQLLGVLVSDLHNPFFAEIVDGIEERAGELGYTPLLATGNRDAEREAGALETFLELRVDGLILLDPRLDVSAAQARIEATPAVMVARRVAPSAGLDTVTNDDSAGAELAVGHLAELGHRRIAHIDSGPGVGGGQARRRGYQKAMRRLGLGGEILIAPGAYTEEGGYHGAQVLLGAPSRPTAVFAANDLAALGAATALAEAGLRIPRDVSLVGYDNTHLAEIRHIGLTSVNQPRMEMGRLAVSCAHERLEAGRRAARRIVLAPTLVARASSAPPA